MPEFSTTRTLAAAADYTAGDVLSDSATNDAGTALTLDPISRYDAGEIVVTHVVVTHSVDGLVPRLDIDLFTENPSASELDDNAAASVAVADRLKYVGTVNMPASTDRGAIAVAEAVCYIPARLVSASKKLYAVIRTVDGFTNESSSMTITIRIFAEPVH